MHKLILTILVFGFGARPLAAATKLLLHDTLSPLGTVAKAGAGMGCNVNTHDWVWRVADTTQGTAAVTKTFAPSSTAPPCYWQTATSSGQMMRWVTAPLASAVTISGNINYQAGCSESNTSTNAGFRFVVYRWSRAVGGINATVMTSATSSECAGANIAIAAAAPTSTNFAAGDRIVIVVQAMNVGTWGGNNSRTISLVYDAASGVYGDTFANFADTITFASDTNNARPVISTILPTPSELFAAILGRMRRCSTTD
jgi:hypothetical protein